MVDIASSQFVPCVYLAPLWRHGRLKFFQEGSSRNRGRSSVGPQCYTDLIYSSSLRSAKSKKVIAATGNDRSPVAYTWRVWYMFDTYHGENNFFWQMLIEHFCARMFQDNFGQNAQEII